MTVSVRFWYIVGLYSAPFPFPNPKSRAELNPVANTFKPDTATLPTGLGSNKSNTVEISSGWWHFYQRCEQLSSRVRLDQKTARDCVWESCAGRQSYTGRFWSSGVTAGQRQYINCYD